MVPEHNEGSIGMSGEKVFTLAQNIDWRVQLIVLYIYIATKK